MNEPAAAAIPSPVWLGVERVVVACHFDPSVQPRALRDSLCRQIADEAARLTAFPVSVATEDDLARHPDLMRAQDRQLVLHVEARLAGEGGRAGALLMSAWPERLGLRAWRGQPPRPLRVGLRWEDGVARLERPVTPIARFFSDFRRDGELPLPPRSDRL